MRPIRKEPVAIPEAAEAVCTDLLSDYAAGATRQNLAKKYKLSSQIITSIIARAKQESTLPQANEHLDQLVSCELCGSLQMLREYFTRKTSRGTRIKRHCKECKLLKRYRHKYALEYEEYHAMLKRQGGSCKICRRVPEDHRLHVDHNHESGEVRGLLCTTCNKGIGQLLDSPSVLLSAAAYLKESGHYGTYEVPDYVAPPTYTPEE